MHTVFNQCGYRPGQLSGSFAPIERQLGRSPRGYKENHVQQRCGRKETAVNNINELNLVKRILLYAEDNIKKEKNVLV